MVMPVSGNVTSVVVTLMSVEVVDSVAIEGSMAGDIGLAVLVTDSGGVEVCAVFGSLPLVGTDDPEQAESISTEIAAARGMDTWARYRGRVRQPRVLSPRRLDLGCYPEK
jgi:hypothetical protein